MRCGPCDMWSSKLDQIIIPHGYNTRTVKCNNYTLHVDKPTNASLLPSEREEYLSFLGLAYTEELLLLLVHGYGPPYKNVYKWMAGGE